MIRLYLHQEQMVAAMAANAKGRIISVTGSGKTYAQAAEVGKLLNGDFSITLIKAPRIILANQLAGEYSKYWNDHYPAAQYCTFLMHSGEGLDFDLDSQVDSETWAEVLDSLNESIDSTTVPTEVRSKILRARELNIPVIIFTTYHSNQKLAETVLGIDLQVDLDINDEAHYLVRDNFSELLNFYSPARQYFFTATEEHTESNEGKGMNNIERFGERIFTLTYQEAVESEIVVPAKPIFVKSHDVVDQETLDANIGDVVEEAFTRVEDEFPQLGAKILVAANGQGHIRTFLESEQCTQLINDGVQVLTIHSATDLKTYNKQVIDRKRFNELLKNFGEDSQARLIVIHHDMLSEGIDVPGLQGVLILRHLRESKFFQTVGRCVRVYRPDRTLKPCGLVMFPHICDPDMAEGYLDLIEQMRQRGYVPIQMMQEYSVLGEVEEEDESFIDQEMFSLSSELNLRLYTEDVVNNYSQELN